MILREVQVGENVLAYLSLGALYANFHFATLEEYYRGTLHLPPCNMVSDGSVFLICLWLVNGIFGNNFWTYGIVDVTWLDAHGLSTLTVG